MSYILSLKVNPECSVLRQISCENDLSPQQKILNKHIEILYQTVENLQSLKFFEFSEADKKNIGRGAYYAITPSLREKINKKELITLTDLQNILNNEFHVKDEETTGFIIKTIFDNDSIPFALVLIPHSFKFNDPILWGNDNNSKNKFEYILKAKSDFKGRNIIFEQKLMMKDPSNNTQGSAHLQFSVDQQKKIKLPPLTMKFTFTDKRVFEECKDILCKDFQNWIFQPRTFWQIKDLWVISNLLGCLVGLSAMVGLLALGLITPISPLLLPLIGLTIGLGLSSILHGYVRNSLEKKEHEKFEKSQQPIYLSNATTFFNCPILDKLFTTPKTFFELKA